MEMKRFYQGIYPTFDEKLFYRLQEFFPNIDVKRSIRRLSKGMQKQVTFWLAICAKPELSSDFPNFRHDDAPDLSAHNRIKTVYRLI